MTLLLACLSNALLAAGLAVIAWLAGRYWKQRPDVAHGLWVLVLIKLLTPPLIRIPFEWTVVREIASEPRPDPVLPALAPTKSEMIAVAPYFDEFSFQLPLAPKPLETTFKEGLIDPKTGSPLLVIEMKPRVPISPVAVTVQPDGGIASMEVGSASLAKTDELTPPEPARPNPEQSFSWANALFGFWLAGAICWLGFALRRITRFHRLLHSAQVPPGNIQQDFTTVALRMGFRCAPRLRLLPGAVTPLVWAVGRATIYFPRDLLDLLSQAQRETLFVHELAHVKRRDHWIRWVELSAVSLYWWFPIAWLARRRIQLHEEECCDGWVANLLPNAAQSYASALLDTIDFLAESDRVPALASGIGDVPPIQQRLLMILHGKPPGSASRFSRLALAIVALAILPLAPTLGQRIIEVEKRASSAESAAADDEKLPAVAAPFEPFAYENASVLLQPPKGTWWSLAVSPDGKTVVGTTGRGNAHPGEIFIWDAETAQLRQTLHEAGPVRCVTFSPSGKHFATGSLDNAVRIYDASSGKLLAFGHLDTGGHSAGVNSVSFSGDGARLASAGLDNTVRIWDVGAALAEQSQLKEGRLLAMHPSGIIEGHPQAVLSVALAKNGKSVLTGCSDGIARVFDLPEKHPTGRFTVQKHRLALKGHSGAIEMVVMSPSGKAFATASTDGTARLWEDDGTLRCTLQGNGPGISALAFSANEKMVATGSGDASLGEINLWETETGNLIKEVGRHKGRVPSLAFAPGDSGLWTLGSDRTIQFWPLRNASPHRELTAPIRPEDVDQSILGMALNRDGKILAVAGDGKSITLWDMEKKAILGTLAGHSDVVNGVVFSSDGTMLASAGNDKTICVWDVRTQKLLHTLKGHANWVFGVAFSSDGTRLASGSYDKTVRIWDAANGQEISVLRGHSAAVRSVAFSPLGDYLASGSSDRTVRLWPLREKKPAVVLRGHKGAIRSIAYSPDGKNVASGAEDKLIKVWDVGAGREVLQMGPIADMVGSIIYSPKGSTIITGSWNGATEIWDAHTGKQRANLFGHGDAVPALAISSDAQTLISAGLDKTIRLWPATPPPPAPQLTFIGHPAALWTIAVSPNHKWVASAGMDGEILLWDASEARLVGTLPGHRAGTTDLRFSSDGKQLASSGKDKRARLWDIEKRREILAFEHPQAVNRAILSPDGRMLATACSDKLIRLFNANTGKLIREIAGHEGSVACLAFNRGGTQLASGGHDKLMCLWNVETGALIQRTPANSDIGQVTEIAFSPDEKKIVFAHNQEYRQPMDDDPGEQPFRNIAIWDIPSSKFSGSTRSFPHFDWITGMSFHPDGQGLISTSRDGIVRHWDFGTHKVVHRFRAHQANIAALAVAADGQSLYTAGDDRVARKWNARPVLPLTAQVRIAGGKDRAWAGAVSPNRQVIASVGDDHSIGLRTSLPGDSIKLAGIQGAAFSVIFSLDGKQVISGHENGEIRVADGATGKTIRVLDAKKQRVWGLAFDKDGKYLAAVTGDWSNKVPGRVIVWNTADWSVRHELEGHSDLVFAVAFSPDGRRLATGSRDSTVRIWDVVEGKLLNTLKQHSGGVRSVDWSIDGKILASAGLDDRLILWDTQTCKDRLVQKYPDKGLCRVAFSADGKTLALGYNLREQMIGEILLCDARTLEVKQTLTGHTRQLLDLAFSPDGNTLVTTGGRYGPANNLPRADSAAFSVGGAGGSSTANQPAAADDSPRPKAFAEILCWDVADGAKLVELPGHQFWVEAVAFSRDGKQLASAGGNEGNPGEVRVWKTAGLSPKVRLKVHEHSVLDGCFNRDGSLLATGCEDKLVIIWDVQKALAGNDLAVRHTLGGHSMPVQKVRFSPDGKRVISASADGVVKVWDVQDGELVRTIPAHTMSILGLAISPDGKTLATTACDWKNRQPAQVRLWDLETGQERARLADQQQVVWDVAFSQDGRKLITAQAGESQIQVWDIATLKPVKKLYTSATPQRIAVTRDGRKLAVGLQNGQVRIWDTSNWQEVSQFEAHAPNRKILDMSFTADASLLITASEDGAAIWNMPAATKMTGSGKD